MENQLTITVISALFGGGFVAVANYFINKGKLDAEATTRDAQVKKLEAETDRIRAEADNIRGNIQVVKSEQEKTGSDLQLQAKEISWLKLIITLIISDYEKMHLQNLASDEPFIAEVKEGSTFESELRHLLTLNLIELLPNKGMRSLFRQGRGDIKEHLSITEPGRKYLAMLKDLNSEQVELSDES